MGISSIVEEDPVPDFLRYRMERRVESGSSVPFWLLMACWGLFASVCIVLLALDAALSFCPLWLIEAGWRIPCVG